MGGRFAKGMSGNPRGRPKKGHSLTDLLQLRGNGDVTVTDPKTGEERVVPYKQLLAERMWEVAVKDPDCATARYIFDRIDGKPKETLNHQGSVGPLVVKFDREYDGV